MFKCSNAKQALASTLLAADLFKSPSSNRPSLESQQERSGKGKGKGRIYVNHQQSSFEENNNDPQLHHWDTRHDQNQNTGLQEFRFSGPSLVDKMKAVAERKGRRVEVVITRDNGILVQASARALSHSLSQNTNRTSANNFALFLGFCERQNLSPVLNGWDKRKDEDTLIAFILYEF